MRRKVIFRAVMYSHRIRRNPVKPIKKLASDVAVATALEVFVHHKAPQISLVIDVTAAHSLTTCIKILF